MEEKSEHRKYKGLLSKAVNIVWASLRSFSTPITLESMHTRGPGSSCQIWWKAPETIAKIEPNDAINSEQLQQTIQRSIAILLMLRLTDPDLRAVQDATRSNLKPSNLSGQCSWVAKKRSALGSWGRRVRWRIAKKEATFTHHASKASHLGSRGFRALLLLVWKKCAQALYNEEKRNYSSHSYINTLLEQSSLRNSNLSHSLVSCTRLSLRFRRVVLKSFG